MVKWEKLKEATGNILYISVQSLLLYYVLKFLSRRLYEPLISDVALFWLFASIVIVYFPLQLINQNLKMVWLIASGIGLLITGIALFGVPVTVALLILGVCYFASRRINIIPLPGDFLKLLIVCIFTIGISYFVFFAAQYPNTEVREAILYFVILFVLSLLGISFSQFSDHKSPNDEEQTTLFKRMLTFQGSFWGWLGIIVFVSVFLYLGTGVIFFGTKTIVAGIATMIGVILNFIIPILLGDVEKFQFSRRRGHEESSILGIDEFGEREPMIQQELLDKISTIFLYSMIVVGILLVLFFLYLYIRRVVKNLAQEEVNIETRRGVIRKIAIDGRQKGDEINWLQRLRNILDRYSQKEDDPVRRQFRELLFTLRKKGIWLDDSMSLAQLTHVMGRLQKSSPLYEKVRYGNQTLADEELKQFEQEIKEFIAEVKKAD